MAQLYPELPSDEETFNECLIRLMKREGVSINELNRRSGLDLSYVWRLVNTDYDTLNQRPTDSGNRRQPSRDTVIRLGIALQLPLAEMEELLLAAGYAGLVKLRP